MTISIIIVTYQDLDGVHTTLESLRGRVSKNNEVIVIDGGTTGIKDIFDKFSDIITSCISEMDAGIYDAMNKGINLAQREWLLFLNGGDKLLHDDIDEVSRQNLVNTSDIVLFGYTTFSNKALRPITRSFPASADDLRKWPCIQHQSVMIKKCLFSNVGHYAVSYKLLSDYDFFCKCLINGVKIEFKPDLILSSFNIDGASGKPSNSLLFAKELMVIQFTHFKRIYLLIVIELTLKYLAGLLLNQKTYDFLRSTYLRFR